MQTLRFVLSICLQQIGFEQKAKKQGEGEKKEEEGKGERKANRDKEETNKKIRRAKDTVQPTHADGN